jgi:hypothetical protein
VEAPNRLLVVPPGEREPRPIDELAAPSQRYFAAAFSLLAPRGLTVYLTWDVAGLPSYGDDVVAVVLGDEAARRARYAGRVRAVLKCYGDRPRFTRAPADALGAAVFLQELRRWAEALGDLRLPAGRHAPAPLGYHNQVDVPFVPVGDRSRFAAFAGSIEEPHRRSLPSAKTVSRRQMVAALERFAARRPDATVAVRATASFGASSEDDPVAYSSELMDTQVALVPRGGSVETFRWFEAMRVGCVVICERLPPWWFYAGSPAIELRRWRALPRVLERLRDDPAELERRSAASLAWWDEHASERALARVIDDLVSGGRTGGRAASAGRSPRSGRRAPTARR